MALLWLRHHPYALWLSPTELLQRQIAVTASHPAGKSRTRQMLLEERRTRRSGQWSPHSEAIHNRHRWRSVMSRFDAVRPAAAGRNSSLASVRQFIVGDSEPTEIALARSMNTSPCMKNGKNQGRTALDFARRTRACAEQMPSKSATASLRWYTRRRPKMISPFRKSSFVAVTAAGEPQRLITSESQSRCSRPT